MHIDEHTAATRWAGESMDYGLAVQVLLQKAEQAQNVPAGASARGVLRSLCLMHMAHDVCAATGWVSR
jgi:hypothetical protein